MKMDLRMNLEGGGVNGASSDGAEPRGNLIAR